MAAEAAGDDAAAPPARGRLTFLDLPVETQREIVSLCSQTDLICVALVSKHFHELASSQLYRNFHIIFPDEDDLAFDSPIDGLAGGLDTLTTSEYNYAKHLRDLFMDTLSSGLKGELSYQSYLYNTSCGKFLNTLLYLTLKKAKSLEAFRWNIRVELSRPVYRELHSITSLKHLHLRMQAGNSYYVPSPPLPANGNSHVPPYKSLPKSKLSRRGSSPAEPSTLGGFKNLQSLSVLDIDCLDIMEELQTCIENSGSCLKALQLSLSEHLASLARKRTPDPDPDDSDVDDDFQVVQHHGSTANNTPGAAEAFLAQEERNTQERFLGRVLAVELPLRPETKATTEGSPVGRSSDNEAVDKKVDVSNLDPSQDFIASLRLASDKLMTVVSGTKDRSTSHQEVLDLIEKAARKYVDSKVPQQSNGDITTGNAEAGEEIGEAGGSVMAASHGAGISNGHAEGSPSPMEDSTISKGPDGTSTNTPDKALEEIDMEHINTPTDVVEESDDPSGTLHGQESPKANKPASSQLSNPLPSANTSDWTPRDDIASMIADDDPLDPHLSISVKYLQDRISVFKDRIHVLRTEGSPAQLQEITQLERKIQAFEGTISDIRKQLDAYNNINSKAKASLSAEEYDPTRCTAYQRKILDYLRETRGLALDTLSIHLVPVKASVLSRSIDLRSLKQLTLLNVGNQAPVWTLLSKENSVQPLPLRKVFTDNVSRAFLTCMSQLEELHELFMLERSPKSKPESFAPRTEITMDQIRRVVLAKHMPTLKRLMIKDEAPGSAWDVNEKTMVHICTRGAKLEELAISLNIQAVHAFMQNVQGLANLRALHILRFRNNDTCIWVMREILRFIVDNLSHHPRNKLEWIAMEDDRVDRIVRTSPAEARLQKERNKKSASKGKAPEVSSPHDVYPTLPSVPLSSDSESDSDGDGFEDGTRLWFKTDGPVQFYDVWGVKIFEKEIRTGCL